MDDEVRLFTLAEAEATLELVRPLLEEARVQVAAVRECEAQMRDLVMLHGEEAQQPDGEGYAEFRVFREKRIGHLHILKEALEAVGEHGVVVKDPERGLVDFFSELGDEVVFLCWMLGEDRIRSWHTLDGGFAGRQAIPGVGLLEP